MTIRPTFKGRIKVGTLCGQDLAVFRWPHLASRKKVDTDMVFDMEFTPFSIICRAKGFGATGDYGNGAIFLNNRKAVPNVARLNGKLAPPCSIIS